MMMRKKSDKEAVWLKLLRLVFLWGFVALMIMGLSFLEPRRARASSLKSRVAEEIPLWDMTEQVRFSVIETHHHGVANAVQPCSELYRCMRVPAPAANAS
jgi:hypothetical protein